jgi:hypothetical protein
VVVADENSHSAFMDKIQKAQMFNKPREEGPRGAFKKIL